VSENASVWLVIPTYNEAANVEAIVAEALEQLPPSRRLLVVDDSSPDGTGLVADRLAQGRDDVAVLHRPAKRGLGPAYVAAFREALAGGAELIAHMDADFSHDPADLPRLLDARAALGVGIRDLTGGFKVFRRRALEAIDFQSLASLGYAFQVETTFRTIRAGLRVVEVPIIFRDRRVGQSKMTGSVVLEAAWRVPAMRLRGR
jgi:dolichol-phosphate mannosyltransferase